VTDSNVIKLAQPGTFTDSLTEISLVVVFVERQQGARPVAQNSEWECLAAVVGR
jgi:hypothetical protein